ncbi:hypothetical protein AAVH_29014 [Aphelenchoides avenae]|nr:hypothetical protein AAVH_29014 [Aphelenchus avenae]
MSASFKNSEFPSYQEASRNGFANYGFQTGRTDTFGNRGFSGQDCQMDFQTSQFPSADAGERQYEEKKC